VGQAFAGPQKYQPDTCSTPPNDAGLLFHIAIKKLKAIRQGLLTKDLETSATGGVIDDRAGDNRQLRSDDDTGGFGHLASRLDSFVQSWMRHLAYPRNGSDMIPSKRLRSE
jgi:hypothetical protein